MAWGGTKKGKQPDTVPGAPLPPETNSTGSMKTTLIGEDAVVKGKIVTKDDLKIAGTVNGELSCPRRVIVASSGKVRGKISCGAIVIHGMVEGDIEAAEQITVAESGRLIGDITTPSFNHQPGGFFEGYSHMAPEQDQRIKKEGKQA